MANFLPSGVVGREERVGAGERRPQALLLVRGRIPGRGRRGRGCLVVVGALERHLYDSGAAAGQERATFRVGSGASLVRVWTNGYITHTGDTGAEFARLSLALFFRWLRFQPTEGSTGDS